ncbi:hypothetical protein ABPG75_009415 [Micractinium tetrahymenae]
MARAAVCAALLTALLTVASAAGLNPNEAPQFILFTHDDAITPTAAAAFQAILNGRRSADGCPAVATLFTLARGTDCELLRGLYHDGYEVASHSLTHQKMNGWSKEQVAAEVLGGRAALASTCGIPEAGIVGWRQPYLQASPTVRQARDSAGPLFGGGLWGLESRLRFLSVLLRAAADPAALLLPRDTLDQVLLEAGYLYDSTILETPDGESVSQGKAARLWPYTLQDGVAQDCKSWSPYQTCAEGERYPGLFEVPVWDLSPTGLFSSDPADRGGRSILEVLNGTFQAAYTGNRAPMPIFVHSSFFTAEGVAAMQRFADYVLSLPHVYFVSMRQLLGWLRRSIPASQLTPALLGCGSAGGAGPEGPAASPEIAVLAGAAAGSTSAQAAPPKRPPVQLPPPAGPQAAPSSSSFMGGGQPNAGAANEAQQESPTAVPLATGAAQGQEAVAGNASTDRGGGPSSSSLAAILGGALGGALAALAVLALLAAAVRRRRQRAARATATAASGAQQAAHAHFYAARMQAGASAFLSVGGRGGRGSAGAKGPPTALQDVEAAQVVEQTGTPGSSARRRGPTPFQ